MAVNEQEIVNLTKAGTLNLTELRTMMDSASGNVTVEDWGVCYNSGTGQLSEYCTVIAANPADPITGIGMLAYSGNGAILYAAQYTNNFSSDTIATSIGTTLYNPQDGNQILCVVYGWTAASSFYLTRTLSVTSC